MFVWCNICSYLFHGFCIAEYISVYSTREALGSCVATAVHVYCKGHRSMHIAMKNKACILQGKICRCTAMTSVGT